MIFTSIGSLVVCCTTETAAPSTLLPLVLGLTVSSVVSALNVPPEIFNVPALTSIPVLPVIVPPVIVVTPLGDGA